MAPKPQQSKARKNGRNAGCNNPLFIDSEFEAAAPSTRSSSDVRDNGRPDQEQPPHNLAHLDMFHRNHPGHDHGDESDGDGGSMASRHSAFSRRTHGHKGTASSSTTTGADVNRNPQATNNVYENMQEAKHVAWSKILVIFVLLIATTVTAMAVFRFTSDNERDDFETRFQDVANQILEVSQVNARDAFHTFEATSRQFASYAQGTDQAWPNVTIPDFEAQCLPAIDHAGAQSLFLMPIVAKNQRAQYEAHWQQDADAWMSNSRAHSQVSEETELPYASTIVTRDWETMEEAVPPLSDQPIFVPASQVAPLQENSHLLNYDGYSYAYLLRTIEDALGSQESVLSEVTNLEQPGVNVSDEETAWPSSFVVAPVFEKAVPRGSNETPNIVAIVAAEMPWHGYFANVAPQNTNGIHLVIKNTCNQTFSYTIDGPSIVYRGPIDIREPTMAEYEESADMTSFHSHCQVSIHIAPSEAFQSTYLTSFPLVSTIVIIVVFVLTAFVFVLYDCLVEKRQLKVVDSANRSNAIINSLFPDNVRERLMDAGGHAKNGNLILNKRDKKAAKNFLNRYGHISQHVVSMNQNTLSSNGGVDGNDNPLGSSPIADFFPTASVLFADLAGFTAWSSTREPTEVFTLLETLYSTFDRSAKALGVFKVETIGDCYVAACGLPEPRDDHSVVIFRFARHCLAKMRNLVTKLAAKLGPDTADLKMRFGIHSGPVTAGVLRGEKSRFQLFGDTVNTASRMESSGIPNKIHLSEQIAKELQRHGKEHWYEPRDDKIVAKGKGQLQTYWAVLVSPAGSTSGRLESQASIGTQRMDDGKRSSIDTDGSSISTPEGGHDDQAHPSNSAQRHQPSKTEFEFEHHINWNIETIQLLLKKIIAMRTDSSVDPRSVRSLSISRDDDAMVLEEVKEIIRLPNKTSRYKRNPDDVELPAKAQQELRNYVQTIASMYHNNPFHSFGHASHVVQSTRKLLSRIVSPKQMWDTASNSDPGYQQYNEKELHDYTFGITSDPITQFACIFAALIHDVDHPGVPNAVLVAEKSEVALYYENKTVAEQNSIDLGWNLLFEPRYENLRACIYSNQKELDRFRQLVVNSVIATDIMDQDLKQLRNARWEKAFFGHEDEHTQSIGTGPLALGRAQERQMQVDRKATIVIEHLIQASDVAHTMQHWHVYVKWNEKLFDEMYRAYQMGRSAEDPSKKWFDGELGFFDFYILPLAKKLKECGVFGVSSDEYYDYAQANRREWELRGREIVQGYLEKFQERNSRRRASAAPSGATA